MQLTWVFLALSAIILTVNALHKAEIDNVESPDHGVADDGLEVLVRKARDANPHYYDDEIIYRRPYGGRVYSMASSYRYACGKMQLTWVLVVLCSIILTAKALNNAEIYNNEFLSDQVADDGLEGLLRQVRAAKPHYDYDDEPMYRRPYGRRVGSMSMGYRMACGMVNWGGRR
ncbi:hypothetical protein Fcan01_01426 [Folsomia candida]|uniref:Uncharacterized protein n=1 Tax=Folsomia candida TaxID=158441 RepID=A0A226F5I0_FOLCA|nr:hypothetical protein Fcan01_01426 [Folsomia candida]